MGKAVAAAVTVASVVSVDPEEAAALGPVKMLLSEPEYHSVVCPPKTQVCWLRAHVGQEQTCNATNNVSCRVHTLWIPSGTYPSMGKLARFRTRIPRVYQGMRYKPTLTRGLK